MFTDSEIAYIKSQPLARIGTASAGGVPDVAPVVYHFDGTYFFIPGLELPRTRKYKNVVANPRASLVIDDLASIKPWVPRGIRIDGRADIVEYVSRVAKGLHIRITAERKSSWGIEAAALQDGKAVYNRAGTRKAAE